MSDLFRYPDRASSTNERWTNCWNKLCRQNLATLSWEIVHPENTKLVQPSVHVWHKNHTNSKARNNIRNTDKNYRKISNIVAKIVHSAWFLYATYCIFKVLDYRNVVLDYCNAVLCAMYSNIYNISQLVYILS